MLAVAVFVAAELAAEPKGQNERTLKEKIININLSQRNNLPEQVRPTVNIYVRLYVTVLYMLPCSSLFSLYYIYSSIVLCRFSLYYICTSLFLYIFSLY